jgi:hypothetical protein
MRAVTTALLVAAAAIAVGCAYQRPCAPQPVSVSGSPCALAPAPISTTTTPYGSTFYNDGHLGTIVTRRDNVFGPDAGTYDVRDLDGLRGVVEVIFLKLPDLALEQGATYADLGGGALRIMGPPKAHAFVKEMLAMLRASPGPRPLASGSDVTARPVAGSRLQHTLAEHGFAPPFLVETRMGGFWMSERPSHGSPHGVDRILIHPGPRCTQHVSIERWTRGPTDWARHGPLMVGSLLDDEARDIEAALN